MKQVIDFGLRFSQKIISSYPPLDYSKIPEDYKVLNIEYRREEIEKFDVIFWHRLLRNLYEEPLEIECEIKEHKDGFAIKTVSFRNTEEKNQWEAKGVESELASKIKGGKAKPIPVNWKYLVWLPNGGILELGTRDNNTDFYIAEIIQSVKNEKDGSKESEKFINTLLDEANRLKKQLFNPLNEFQKKEGPKIYSLFNVYLSNYLSAREMLRISSSHESHLKKEFLEYARTTDMYDNEKKRHSDISMLMCGMYYSSAISFFIMALEGFVNLVFHALVKQRFGDKEFRIDQRLDFEQKLRLMSSLCHGFDEKKDEIFDALSEFKSLKNYRNSLFHAKVEESLKSLCFLEDGFIYNYDLDAYKESYLPSHKIKLTEQDVMNVKGLVDGIIYRIMESMDRGTKRNMEKYVLKEPYIPFVLLESGELVMGENEKIMSEIVK